MGRLGGTEVNRMKARGTGIELDWSGVNEPDQSLCHSHHVTVIVDCIT